MAMYYQSSSEIQADGLQTLYLMNPNYVGYSDTQPSMLFLNSAATAAAHALNSAPTHHAPLPQPQQFVGIPLSHDPSRPSPVLTQQHGIPAAAQSPVAAAPHHCNRWGLIDQAASGEQNQPPDMPQQTPRGLSLSLSAAHHQTVGFDKSSISGDRDLPAPPTEAINGVNTMQSVMMGSKYLKAAQELLDEVVSVGNSDAKTHRPEKAKASREEEETGSRGGGGIGSELTTAQRQEIQMKKAKLNNMLDEVEQRCRQYHQQMQIIVGSFEQAAGIGSAKSYTQLALKTILKQFRCLKSSISSQIKGLSKSLGEEESSGNKLEGSRLKFVDTQQRALQQLGMMHNNAWRPQRGLPERAVSVLRAWLFEHFLHPYPKDSDKQMLAKQTGLTRSQVSNWFINARVRLWKPMVEEMYIEETKNNQNQFPSTNIDGGASIKPEPDNRPPRTTAPPPPEITPSAPLPARTNFAELISSLNMENLPEKSPKKPRNASSLSGDHMEMRGGGDEQTAEIKRFSTENYLSANINRFGADEQQLAAGGFAQGNSFSLSLGLPPTAHNFLSHRNFELVEGGGIDEAAHPTIGYEILDFQNRKPFPPQLLPDFVA